MKVIYPICCGVDVHKTFLVGTIISTTNDVQPHYQKKRFSPYNSDLHRFAYWLHANSRFDVCMDPRASIGYLCSISLKNEESV